jgi:hypothetical protein
MPTETDAVSSSGPRWPRYRRLRPQRSAQMSRSVREIACRLIPALPCISPNRSWWYLLFRNKLRCSPAIKFVLMRLRVTLTEFTNTCSSEQPLPNCSSVANGRSYCCGGLAQGLRRSRNLRLFLRHPCKPVMACWICTHAPRTPP